MALSLQTIVYISRSEFVEDSIQNEVEGVLCDGGIILGKIQGFDRAPNFIIRGGFKPEVIIEAKITEDDDTACDKVTRIQHLAELSKNGRSPKSPKFEVIACIGGLGFGVRREDMKKMLLATRGKVFTLKMLDRLTECSRLKEFSPRTGTFFLSQVGD